MLLFADLPPWGWMGAAAGALSTLIAAAASALVMRSKARMDARTAEATKEIERLQADAAALKIKAEALKAESENNRYNLETENLRLKMYTAQYDAVLNRINAERDEDRQGITHLREQHTHCMQENASLIGRLEHCEARGRQLEEENKSLRDDNKSLSDRMKRAERRSEGQK